MRRLALRLLIHGFTFLSFSYLWFKNIKWEIPEANKPHVYQHPEECDMASVECLIHTESYS